MTTFAAKLPEWMSLLNVSMHKSTFTTMDGQKSLSTDARSTSWQVPLVLRRNGRALDTPVARLVSLLTDVSADQLEQAVEGQHVVKAVLAGERRVKETFARPNRLDATVHSLTWSGIPKAIRADAWSSPTEGGDKRRPYALLHLGGIRLPLGAMRRP
jgi:hypothetical protein